MTFMICTYVSCVPKKKIGILFGGGFTAPSATSSICKQTTLQSEKEGETTRIVGLKHNLRSAHLYLMHVFDHLKSKRGG